MSRTTTETFFHPSWQRETPLPKTRPLALTTNFFWIVGFCFLLLQILPLLVAAVAAQFFR